MRHATLASYPMRYVKFGSSRQHRNDSLRHLVPAVNGPSWESMDSDDLSSLVTTLVSIRRKELASFMFQARAS